MPKHKACSHPKGSRDCLRLEERGFELGHGPQSIRAVTPASKCRKPGSGSCHPLPIAVPSPFPAQPRLWEPSPAEVGGGVPRGRGRGGGSLPSKWLLAGAQQLRRRIYVPLPLIGNSVSRRKICTVLRPSFLLYHYYWRKVDLET